jgi:hypothetical protein
VKGADVAIIVAAALAFPIWIYSVRQQWSQKPGSGVRMLSSSGLLFAIILIGMAAAYLLS